ncbi:ubiquitin family protein [Ceratobasidium sp. AG-Ba]|nr:ubiquitin family protein [Ceratobasidium sp. AG-Ba]
MSNNLNNLGPAPPPYYLANYQGQVVAIKRDPDYQATIKLIQKYITSLRSADRQDIVISTSFAVYGDVLAQISEEIWPDIVGHVESVEITLENNSGSEGLGGTQNPEIPPAGTNSEARSFSRTNTQKQMFASVRHSKSSTALLTKHTGPLSVTLRTAYRDLIPLGDLPDSTTSLDLKTMVETRYGIPVALQQLVLSSELLDNERKIKQPGTVNGEPVDLILKTRKSAIYLVPADDRCSPTPLSHIMIQLSVNRKWECIASGSPNDSPEDHIQSVSWTASLTSEESMYDHGSESEIYWFWWDGSPSVALPASNIKALNNVSVQLSHTAKTYQPMFELKFNNSVAVPFHNVEKYVSKVLHSWGANRLELISYFLAEVNSKPRSYLAIRFLPQADYKKTANLSIPGQDRITIVHIVLLYKPLNPESVPLWNQASPHESEYASGWKHMNETGRALSQEYRREAVVVDFTFLEVP